MSGQSLRHVVGVDLGGTKIDIGIVDEKGQILQIQRLTTLVEKGPTAIESQILDTIRYLQTKVETPLLGVGIGVPGQIHPLTGEVIFAPNLKWHDIPLQANLEKALHLPVRIVNDVRAITWGEWLYGAGQECNDLVCLFIGTGIGSGIVSGGRLLSGFSNTFGEVGHMTVDFNGPQCTCGNWGCLEAFAGGWGIAERMRKAIETDAKGEVSRLLLEMVGQDLSHMTAKIVIEAYRQGDPLASQVIECAQRALIAGCTSIVNAFNPQRLILGGGIIDGLPEWVEIINQGVRKLALKAPILPLEVIKAKLGKGVGVIGSAGVIFNMSNSISL